MSIARAARNQHKDESDKVSSIFPGVDGIVISMTYRQNGVLAPMQRTINFFPGSSAVFKINCLNEGCDSGSFDFTQVISSSVKERKNAAKGHICCSACEPGVDFSDVSYDISFRYSKNTRSDSLSSLSLS